MIVGPIGPYVIESEFEADEYLTALLEKPEYRSMDEVHKRAAEYIKDEHLKNYFVNQAMDILAR
jgi:hypothetical protein